MGLGSVPIQGTKILQALQHSTAQQKKKKKQTKKSINKLVFPYNGLLVVV